MSFKLCRLERHPTQDIMFRFSLQAIYPTSHEAILAHSYPFVHIRSVPLLTAVYGVGRQNTPLLRLQINPFYLDGPLFTNRMRWCTYITLHQIRKWKWTRTRQNWGNKSTIDAKRSLLIEAISRSCLPLHQRWWCTTATLVDDAMRWGWLCDLLKARANQFPGPEGQYIGIRYRGEIFIVDGWRFVLEIEYDTLGR